MKIKPLIVGLILGCGLMFLTLWSLGFRKSPDEASLVEHYRPHIKSDIGWFLEMEGYPQLAYQNADLVAALSEPDKVTVYRVNDKGVLKVAGYGLIFGTDVSKDDAKYFSTVLCSPTSMTGASACEFRPGFAIRFDHGSQSFYALVCYSCSDIYFINAEGEHVSSFGMTYEAKLALLNQFHTLFPNDAEVQNLKL